MKHLVVQETDYDALNCKIAAMAKNYLPDDVIEKYIPNYNQIYFEYLPALKQVMLQEQQDGQGGSVNVLKQHEESKLKRTLQKISRKCSVSTSAATTPGSTSTALGSSSSFGDYRPRVSGNSFNNPSTNVRSSNPIMNIGTYLRTTAIDHLLLEKFNITSLKNVQVINLGCGSDLRYFQYRSVVDFHKYLDIDFTDTISLKSKILKAESPLFKQTDTDSKEHEYNLISMDLNDINQFTKNFEQHIDPSYPLIIISECCFCYMPDEKVNNIIDYVNSKYSSTRDTTLKTQAPLHWACYDPISGVDKKFGQIMYQNLLMTRNLKMYTLLQYSTLQLYKDRMHSDGSVQGSTMWDLFTHLSQKEKLRISKCEFLDELEELQIILSHYVVVYT